MTKAELIASIAKEANIPKASAEKALNALTSSVTKSLKKGDKLTLTGFGTFSVVKRRARTGRNPQTGQEIKIRARRVATFKGGMALKAIVSGYELAHACGYMRALGKGTDVSPIVYNCPRPRCNYRRYLRIVPNEPPRCQIHGVAMRRER